MTYRETTVRCETCGGSGTIIAFRRLPGEYQAGEPVEVICYDCDGEGEWPAECAECHEAKPLNRFGICEECDLASLVDVERISPNRVAA